MGFWMDVAVLDKCKTDYNRFLLAVGGAHLHHSEKVSGLYIDIE